LQIPITVGVTGHRRLRDDCVPVLRRAVSEHLKSLRSRYPNSPIRMLTGLAVGGDTICTQEAAALGIPYAAVLPFEKERFLADFEEEEKTVFLALYESASSVLIAPPVERPRQTDSRNYCFRQVGVYMAEHSHVLLALWDGAAPVPGGCGTAEVADMLLSGSYCPRDGAPAPGLKTKQLVHILAPRSGAPSARAGSVTILGSDCALAAVEQFNRRNA